jgi:serine/threonine protein kinase
MAVRDETSQAPAGDPGQGTSGTATTDDPLGTVPNLGEFEAASEAPASFAVDMGAAAGRRYRILGTLGEGGMGVVYRAEDTRLGRNVAVKTVPAERTANLWAKERFLNEARAASALDHPNLCTIYEIEETGTGQLFLTMPCYDGETLRSRLQRGPLALLDAVHIAQQAARGLAKVHGLGIVHCDIKPANLMLTADGVVKILDFGIARLSGPAPHIQAGPYGTRGYRSPEQARGDEVDASSDVWSLGVVLYEMLTGRPPGRDEHGEALPWEELDPVARQLPEAPPELSHLLSRMLARDPADRYTDAAALLIDFERWGGRISPPATHRALRFRGRRRAAGVTLSSVCLVILCGYFFVERKLPQTPAEYILTQISEPPGWASYPSLSPDGSTVLYVKTIAGRSHIFSQAAARGADAIDLSANSPADDTQPSFSPDGQQIAFRSERDGGGLFLMSSMGGAVHRLSNLGFNPAWSPNGKEIVCGTASIESPQFRTSMSSIFRINVATGARCRVTQVIDSAQPSWSPHGLRIAYWGLRAETGQPSIWTVPAGEKTIVSESSWKEIPAVDDGHLNWNPVWSRDGRYLYFASDRGGIMSFWRISIDEETGQVKGKPEPVITSEAGLLPSFSRDGRLMAYASDTSRGVLERVDFDPGAGKVSGHPALILDTSSMIGAFVVSPDGGLLLYQLLTPREELFVIRPNGTGRRRLISDQYRNRYPRFSPRSARFAFHSNRGGRFEIWTAGVEHLDLRQETSIHTDPVVAPLWSPDGKTLACSVAGREALLDLTKPLGERSPDWLPPPGPAHFRAYSWSADGKWLAGGLTYQLQQAWSQDPGISIYSLAERKYEHLTRHGTSAIWLHDSRRLLYSEGERILLLDTETKASRPILASPPGSTYRDFSLSPDDRVLYLARTSHEGQIWLLKL